MKRHPPLRFGFQVLKRVDRFNGPMWRQNVRLVQRDLHRYLARRRS